MKLQHPKEWFEERVETTGEVEIEAGILPVSPLRKPNGWKQLSALDLPLTFGQLVNFWRRNQGWKPEKLAMETGLGIAEIREIERLPNYQPAAATIVRLAELLSLPPQRLFELVGLAETSVVRENASATSTLDEWDGPLADDECKTLEAFLITLAA